MSPTVVAHDFAKETGSLDPDSVTAMLSSEYPLLDYKLVHMLVTDFTDDQLSDALQTLRLQLGIYQAELIPDTEPAPPIVGADVKEGGSSGSPEAAFEPAPSKRRARAEKVKSKAEFETKHKEEPKEAEGSVDHTEHHTDEAGDAHAGWDHVRQGNGTDSYWGWTSEEEWTDTSHGSSYGSDIGEDDGVVVEEILALKQLFPNFSKSEIISVWKESGDIRRATEELLSLDTIREKMRRGDWSDDDDDGGDGSIGSISEHEVEVPARPERPTPRGSRPASIRSAGRKKRNGTTYSKDGSASDEAVSDTGLRRPRQVYSNGNGNASHESVPEGDQAPSSPAPLNRRKKTAAEDIDHARKYTATPDRFLVRKTKLLEPRAIPGSPSSSSADLTKVPSDDRPVKPGYSSTNRYVLDKNKQVHPQNYRKVDNKRVPRTKTAHPYASHIPAYSRGALPNDTTPGSLYGSNGGELSAEECRRRAQLERNKHATAVRQAARNFRSGHMAGGRAVGGAIAGAYALQARETFDRARRWELEAARMDVNSQLATSGHRIDLHGMTITEACTVAEEAAGRWFATHQAAMAGATGAGTAGAFTIITGKGNHSAGRRGVLGPAVSNSLENSGWKTQWDPSRGVVMLRGRR